jgi:hypothetical protein
MALLPLIDMTGMTPPVLIESMGMTLSVLIRLTAKTPTLRLRGWAFASEEKTVLGA